MAMKETEGSLRARITVYLYRSVERLAADIAAKSGIAPPPPQAKVV
ncbi:MAG TPA: hypothetical protein VIV58_29480 [Kofleriaceae bacterium]